MMRIESTTPLSERQRLWVERAQEAAEASFIDIAATIDRYRECGVEIERFHLYDHRPSNTTQLAIDGVIRASWQINLHNESGFDRWER